MFPLPIISKTKAANIWARLVECFYAGFSKMPDYRIKNMLLMGIRNHAGKTKWAILFEYTSSNLVFF